MDTIRISDDVYLFSSYNEQINCHDRITSKLCLPRTWPRTKA